MGGLGSGAWRLYPRVEETPSINLDDITNGLCPEDRWFGGSCGGVWYRLALGGSGIGLHLEWSAGGADHEQHIPLLERRTPTGGCYWVGWCPIGGYAVRRLYLTSDGRTWAGRRTLGLKHASTAESALDRANRQVAKVEARLVARGCTIQHGQVVDKPRYCRSDWVERMRDRVDATRDRADWEFTLAACRIVPALAAEVFARILASPPGAEH